MKILVQVVWLLKSFDVQDVVVKILFSFVNGDVEVVDGGIGGYRCEFDVGVMRVDGMYECVEVLFPWPEYEQIVNVSS